jgi:hypothetical protein
MTLRTNLMVTNRVATNNPRHGRHPCAPKRGRGRDNWNRFADFVAAHRINFVPVMAPESLLKDIAELLVNNSATFETTDIGRKTKLRLERRVDDFPLPLRKSALDQICELEVLAIGNYFSGGNKN